MSVIILDNYADNLEPLLNADADWRRAEGKLLRNSDTGEVSVYDHVRWKWFSKDLKQAWKSSIPQEVVDTYLTSTLLRIPADGKLYPTTIGKQTATHVVGCFLSIALKDNQHIIINGNKYSLGKGDAILFSPTDTWETDSVDEEALWSVNIVPAYKKDTYGKTV